MRTGFGSIAAALALASGAQAQEVFNEKEVDDVSVQVTAACGNYEFDNLNRDQQLQYMTCLQREAAAGFKARMPMRIDEYTTATDITANGTIVTYWMTISLPRERLPASVIADINRAVRESACSDANMAVTIRRGGGYRYVWSDQAGETVGEVTIERC